MVKRLLDCSSSDFRKMNRHDMLEAIKLSEGRVIMSEVIGALQPLLYNISNAELACAFGADMLLLNMFDVYDPVFNGINCEEGENIISAIKRLTGRLIGINLEPVDDTDLSLGQMIGMSRGRIAGTDTAKKALEMGVDYILITGNPGTNVSNSGILKTIREIRGALGDNIVLASGKMHAAGVIEETGNSIITKYEIETFIDAGADIILLPAPGTVPGITMEYIKELIDFSHSKGVIAMTAIGTSQEGADEDTIKNIALMCKMAGADIHHIGDAGYPGIAIPENILAYGLSIRGKRHTYGRMARSINR